MSKDALRLYHSAAQKRYKVPPLFHHCAAQENLRHTLTHETAHDLPTPSFATLSLHK